MINISNALERYSKVGKGAWAAKALYDLVVTALLINQFEEVEDFLAVFDLICADFGGESAFCKLKNAANLLEAYGKQSQLAEHCRRLAREIKDKPLAPPCISLLQIKDRYDTQEIIASRVDEICGFLNCHKSSLERIIKKEINSDVVPQDWAVQIPCLYKKAYDEWFSKIAELYLMEFLPKRTLPHSSPCVKIADWSSGVWRCWRFLDRPTLVDPGIFRPSQFFVWHVIHDAAHIWQMQAYGNQWSNILSPNEFLFLEAQAMCAEKVLLHLIRQSIIEIPNWYPSSKESIVLRLLLGLLEREIRLDLDLKVHLNRQSFSSWLGEVSMLTSLSPEYFQGLTAELLGMPGFCAAYTVVTDNFQNTPRSQREMMLQGFPNISYEAIISTVPRMC